MFILLSTLQVFLALVADWCSCHRVLLSICVRRQLQVGQWCLVGGWGSAVVDNGHVQFCLDVNPCLSGRVLGCKTSLLATW